MATPNIVPRTDSEGGLGTAAKRWLAGYFRNLYADKINGGTPASTELVAAARISSLISENGIHFPGAGSAEWLLPTPLTGDVTLHFPVRLRASIRGFLLNLGGLRLEITTGNALMLRITGGADPYISGWGIANMGVPTLLSLRRAADKISVYQDGAEILTNTAPINSTHTIPQILIGDLAGTGAMDASVGPPVVVNYAQSSAEIAVYSHAGLSGGDRLPGSFGPIQTGPWTCPDPTTAFAGISSTDSTFTAASDPAKPTNRAVIGIAPVEVGGYARVKIRINTGGGVLSASFARPVATGFAGEDIYVISSTADTTYEFVIKNKFTEPLAHIMLRDNVPAAGRVVTVTEFAAVRPGAVIRPRVASLAQIRDMHGRIHGRLTGGARPLTSRSLAPITFSQSASGYVLGDHPSIYDPHVIWALEAKPLTATAPDVALRRHGPSGTVVVASASAGIQDTWTRLAVLGAGAEGPALARYHLTFSASAECQFRLVPQPL